jgi:secretion/DNA translocation related TadE-like protein
VLQIAHEVAGQGGSASAAVQAQRGPDASVVVRVRRTVHLVLPGGPAVTVRSQAWAEPEQVSDRGNATVLVAAVAALAAALAVTLALVSGIVVARHRAQAAADLAALAAANAAPVTCAAAERVARANGARLLSCRPDGDAGTVEVVVAVRPPGVAGRLGQTVGRARAGQGWR